MSRILDSRRFDVKVPEGLDQAAVEFTAASLVAVGDVTEGEVESQDDDDRALPRLAAIRV